MIDRRLARKINKKYTISAICLSILNGIFIVINAYLLAFVISSVFIEKKAIDELYIYIFLFLINAAIKSITNLLIDKKIKEVAEEIKEDIRQRLYEKILKGKTLTVRSKKIGELITILNEGMENITPYFASFIPQAFTSVIVPLILIVATILIDPISAAIMAITYPLIPIFMILIGSKSKEINEKQWNKLVRLTAHFVDMIQGLSTLKIFGIAKLQEEKIFLVSEEYRKTTMKVLRVSFLSAFVLELAGTISTAVIAVNLGLRLVYGKIDLLSAFFVLVLAPDFYLPMRNLGLKFHASLNAKVAIDVIENLENQIEDESDLKKEDTLLDNINIKIQDLSFSYENNQVLKNINLTINHGEKVALVGESGGGKTTLLNIMSGLQQVQRDKVYINNRDINTISKRSLNESVAVLNQFPHIFNDSIKNNILMGKEISEKEFQYVCKITNVNEFIKKLNINYDMTIGEGEMLNLSGGEKQRVSLARAMVKESPLVIMDEPTSALDVLTECTIIDVIMHYFKDKTLIISSHRLNTIKKMDRVVFVKDGEIKEQGNHDELIKLNGDYYNYLKKAGAIK